MKMQWKKYGLIFCPSKENETFYTHAAVPIAQHLFEDIFKIIFSSRDINNRSYTNYIVVDLNEPSTILDWSKKPLLTPGELGCFDDSGSMASWLIEHNNTNYLYYIGWNLGVTVPFRNSIGLAVMRASADEFTRFSKGPVVDRTMEEPHFTASCCVMIDNNIWKMWYLSCTGWEIINGVPKHNYHIKYAESDDGLNWRREGVVAIDFAGSNEFAISRPSVLKDKDGWHMWYSYRGESYRIGYAQSPDGINWTRLDHLVGMDVSAEGWDSEMIEYPFVFDHKNKRYMLYNGNGYGRTGFGLAVLEND